MSFITEMCLSNTDNICGCNRLHTCCESQVGWLYQITQLIQRLPLLFTPMSCVNTTKPSYLSSGSTLNGDLVDSAAASVFSKHDSVASLITRQWIRGGKLPGAIHKCVQTPRKLERQWCSTKMEEFCQHLCLIHKRMSQCYKTVLFHLVNTMKIRKILFEILVQEFVTSELISCYSLLSKYSNQELHFVISCFLLE